MRNKARNIIFLILLLVVITPNLQAQSGRNRPDSKPSSSPPSNPNPPSNPPSNPSTNPSNNSSTTKPVEPKKDSSTNNSSSPNTKPNTNVPPGRVLVPSGAAIVSQDHTGVTSHYVFKNGVTVIVREDHSIPIAASTVMIKAGTSYEAEDQTGVSRVVERLLAESANNEQDPLRQLRLLGGVLKSKTDFESTSYSLLGQSANFTKLLEMQFRSLQRQSFAAEDVNRAAKFVLQTNRYKLDDPFSYSQQRVLQAAFDNNPNQVILDETKLITKEQAQAFYDKYYRGGNVIVVVVGDITADAARLAAQQFLGALKPSEPSAKQPASKPAEANPIRYLAERADINQTVVSVGYRVTDIKDSAVFEVLSAILTQGRGALLPQALIEPSFASKVGAGYVTTNKGALFTFQMQVVPEKLVKAENALFDQVEALRRIILSPADLQRAKSLLEKNYYDSTLDLTRLSNQIAAWELRGGYKNFDGYIKRIKAVTSEQVQQLAAQYFNFNTSIVHEYEPRNAPARLPGSDPIYTPDRFDSYIKVLVPDTHKESIAKEEITYASEKLLAKQGKEKSDQTTESGFILELQPQPVREFSTLHGPRAIVREDQARPLISVGIFYQGGRILEKDNNGITELMLRSILRGTQRQTGPELASFLEQLGAEVKIINEPEFFGYTVEVLSRNAEVVMKQLITTMENPLFDKDDVAREKAGLLAAIQASKDDGALLATQLTNNLLYGDHPYGFPLFGSEKTVSKFSETDVVEWYQKIVKHQLPLVVIVGDTEGSSLVGRLVADGFPRSDQQLDRALAVPVVTVHSSAAEKIETRERRQTSQVLNFSTPEGKSKDKYAIDVIRQLVDGPGGRILTSIQQQQLSFDFSTETKTNQQRSSFLIYLNSAPDQEQKARAVVEDEFRRLINSPANDQELAAARSSAAAEQIQYLRDHTNRAIAYARYTFLSLPFADVDEVAEKVLAVSKDDVKRVLQSCFTPEKRALGVVRGVSSPTPAQSAMPNTETK